MALLANIFQCLLARPNPLRQERLIRLANARQCWPRRQRLRTELVLHFQCSAPVQLESKRDISFHIRPFGSRVRSNGCFELAENADEFFPFFDLNGATETAFKRWNLNTDAGLH